MVLADQLSDRASSIPESEWIAYEDELEYLPPSLRMERYNDLAFEYLANSKIESYQRLNRKFAGRPNSRNQQNNRYTQRILDAFATRADTGDYDEAERALKALIRSGKLTDAQLLRAHIALSYVQADNGAHTEAHQTLYYARMISKKLELTNAAIVELESLSAYVLMISRDYAKVLGSMQISAEARAEYGMPHDTTSTLLKTAYMLRDAGYTEAAREVRQQVDAAQANSREIGGGKPEFDPEKSDRKSRTLSSASSVTDRGTAKKSYRTSSDVPEVENESGFPIVIILIVIGALSSIAVGGYAVIKLIPRKKELPETTAQEATNETREIDEYSDAEKPNVEPEKSNELAIPTLPVNEVIVSQPIDGFLSGKRVMIVDDNPVNVELMSEYLEVFGSTSFFVANDGIEAVSTATQVPLDLVLMDIQMPHLNGIDATKKIRKLPDVPNMPIIAVTAFSRIVNENMCFEAGMNGFITKPVDIDTLETQIRKALGKQQDDVAA